MAEITYLGHSGFILTAAEHKLVIDPFLTGNPLAAMTQDEVKADFVLLTHGHGDHLGDGIQIARASNATIIAPFELAQFCGNQGADVHPMHIGGGFDFPFGRVKLTPALHGSAVVDEAGITCTGNPVGFLIELEGKSVYHAGDTGLFSDMKLIGDSAALDLALLPIGDNFTMGPDDALIAAGWLHPQLVIPMHYNTFDVIQQDPQEYVLRLTTAGLQGRVMESGETLEF